MSPDKPTVAPAPRAPYRRLAGVRAVVKWLAVLLLVVIGALCETVLDGVSFLLVKIDGKGDQVPTLETK